MVRIPLLDMIELSVDAALGRTGPAAWVGILGSPALRRIGVFDRALAARGLVPVYPADEGRMLTAIRTVKSAGPTAEAAAALEVAARGLEGQGADLALIACTEFSMIADRVTASLPLIDTLDVLVGAVRDFAFDETLEGKVPHE